MDTWLARLPPQPAALGAHNLTATSGTERVELTGVQWGDVFVCAGQSNMDYTRAPFTFVPFNLRANSIPERPPAADAGPPGSRPRGGIVLLPSPGTDFRNRVHRSYAVEVPGAPRRF